MSYTPPLNGGRINATISGNTAGVGALISSGTLNLAGGNNITLSQNANSITISAPNAVAQSNQSIGLYALGNTTQNSSTTLDARTLSFNGLGAATMGYSNGSIQVSVPAQSVQPGIQSIQVSNTTWTTGNVIFSNANGLSFGSSAGGAVTASYTVPNVPAQTNQTLSYALTGNTAGNSSGVTIDARSITWQGLGAASVGASTSAGGSSLIVSVPNVVAQTNQTVGMYALGNTTQNSSSTFDARTISYNGLGGVTVGYSNGSVQISGPQTVAQTNQSIGLYALGNTTQNSSTTLDARTLSFNGLGDITMGYSNGSIQVSGNQTNQTVGLYALGNTTQNSSTTRDARSLSFNGLGMITAGYSNGSIQLSATQSNQNISLYALGNTTQNSSTLLNASNLSFNGIGAASMGYSNGSIQVSVPAVVAQTNQTVGLYALGNTTQNSSTTLDARTLSFNGLGMITAGYSNGSIQLSASQSADTVGLYALGNTTQNSSSTRDIRSLSFNGLGGATVGYSNGSIQISGAQTVAQTNQSIGLYALGNTTQNSSTTLDARTLSFNGLGIITAGYSNGSIQLSATQSNQSIGLYAVSNTTQNSSTTLDARTLSFQGAGIASVGYSNGSVVVSVPSGAASPVNFSAGTTSNNLGSVVFSNSNNFSFGLNGSTITASFSESNQTIGLYALGNTTQNSSTTLDARTLSFNGLGMITAGYSNGSIQLSATQSNQNISLYALGNTTQNSSSLLNASNLSFNGLGNASVGFSNGSIQIFGGGGGLAAIVDGAATISSGSISLSDANNFSWGINGQTLTGSAAAQTNQSIGLYALGNTTQNSSTTLDARTLSFNGLGAATMGYSNGSIQVSVPQQATVSDFYRPEAVTVAATRQANSSVSVVPFLLQAPLAMSNFRLGASVSAGSAANNSSASQAYSLSVVLYTRNVSTLNSIWSGSSADNSFWTSNNTTMLAGARGLNVTGVATTLNPDHYWAAVHLSTTNTGTGGNTTALAASYSMIVGVSGGTAAMGMDPWNAGATNQSRELYHGLGLYSTNATRASIGLNDANLTQSGNSATMANLMVHLRNWTLY